MDQSHSEAFIKQAFQALTDRGIAAPECFLPSTVKDENIDVFEEWFDVKLPVFLKVYLKANCYMFRQICSPVPEDIEPGTIQSDGCSLRNLWLELFHIPLENPLRDLTRRMEGFREVTTDEGLIGLTPEQIAHLLPIGDWFAGAGPLCIDLSIPERDIDINDESTWSLQFFDHEEFDWNAVYMDEDGIIRGDRVAPDFKTLLEWYFYGKYDKTYELQEGKRPNYSTYIKYI